MESSGNNDILIKRHVVRYKKRFSKSEQLMILKAVRATVLIAVSDELTTFNNIFSLSQRII